MLDLEKELGDWYPIVKPVLDTTIGANIGNILSRDLATLQPSIDKVFRALTLTQLKDVKVVILGQDPYPGGHADGLAFSSGISHIPESLRQLHLNMKKNNLKVPPNGSLEGWAKQGVLLLNVHLTTTKGYINAHEGIGWSNVTHRILEHVRTRAIGNFHTGSNPTVFIGWGKYAQDHLETIGIENNQFTCLLTGNHPAATRHGYIFRGGEHLNKANDFLMSKGINAIRWND